MSVPFLDLKAQFASIEGDIRAAIDRVLVRQAFILGDEVEACENEIAAYCGSAHGIGVSSGTDALLVALMALGIGPGDEVIVPTYSFFATAGAVARLGARPVFVDIDPVTFNIDPSAAADAVTSHSRAIIPVHLFGKCADMDPILDLARSRGLAVIEDAAQAIGAEYKGQRAGSMGDVGCFSFFPSKNLGACGDGGMAVTNDSSLAKKMKVLRVHGSEPKYYHAMIGGNFRLDALQSAVVRAKLPYLDGWSADRAANASRYDDLLADLPQIVRPRQDRDRHVFNQYVVRLPARDAVMTFLKKKGIGCEIYYPLPLHNQPCFAAAGIQPVLPQAEAAARESLALPIYPELSKDQIAEVAGALRAALS